MKKRIVCILLTLIMLVSLVPAAAMPAAAASNAVSESAIYVLKQLEGYSKYCDGMYIGYGSKCPNADKKGHDATCTEAMFEKEADIALREELKVLDAAVNSFAGRTGGLTQSQHDALVLFSFANGTAWTMGTGAFQTAIKSGYTGSKFLDAICKWNYGIGDDARRMVEANMYLNGVYSATAPSRFIRVQFNVDAAQGKMNEDTLQYFDVASPVTIALEPAPVVKDTSFQGWYTKADGGERVSALTSKYHNLADASGTLQLYALWQDDTNVLGRYDGPAVLYTISKSALSSTTVYNTPNGDKITTFINHDDKEVAIKLGNTLNVTADHIDSKGNRWVRIVEVYTAAGGDITRFIGWVKVKGGTASTGSSASMDVTVTVTNTYVNMRSNAGVYSTQVGTCYQGEQLNIINTSHASSDSFLWGEVANADGSTRGWVAVMYTNYDSVVAGMNGSAANNGKAIATATITYNGYVNVRSGAGINNQIVGALSYGVTVDLYQVEYVNSVLWGRTDLGWFCLKYADVSNKSLGSTNTDSVGFSNYVFEASYSNWEGTLPSTVFVKEAGGTEFVDPILSKRDDGSEYEKTMSSGKLVLTNLVDIGGTDWAKTSYGWIEVGDVTLTPAKFYVITDTLTVRQNASTASDRVDVLVKGTEFMVDEIDVVGHDITGVNNTVWGKANKVGETTMTYGGYVNLANDNVSRNGVPEFSVGGSGSTATGPVKMAKVVGTERLRVRITGATYGKQVGTLTYGTTAAVLEEKDGWYNLDIDVDNDPSTGSWVSGQYLEFFESTVATEGSSNGAASGKVETGKGIVANTYTGVNIRTGPSTAYQAVGKYMVGTVVEILEVRPSGNTKWGRTEKGWVCMDYIVMTDFFAPSGSGTAGSNGSTTGSEVAIYTGTAVGEVKIYKTTNANDNNIVRTIQNGEPITLHELLIVQRPQETEVSPENDAGSTTTLIKEYWARVNDGYIYAPGVSNIALDTLDEHVYTVAVDGVDVFDAMEGNKLSFELDKGEKVIVTELSISKANVWGKVERADYNEVGWVKLANMTKGFASVEEPKPEETPDAGTTAPAPSAPPATVGSMGNVGTGTTYAGKIIRENVVNVRATASLNAAVSTTLKNGAAVNIYETVISESMAWGRCDSGWIYLYYVDLTPVGSSAVDAMVVYTEGTPIYSDMNMTTPTGSTYGRMAVVNIYEKVGNMSRTDLGWVQTINLG